MAFGPNLLKGELIMAANVFISYSSEDENIAQELAAALTELGVKNFLDKKDIAPGEDINKKIKKELSECSAVIVIVSPATARSSWVPFEIGHAMAKQKKILPFLTHQSLEDGLPSYLRAIKYVTSIEAIKDAFNNPENFQKQNNTNLTDKEKNNSNELIQLAPSARFREILSEFTTGQFNGHIAIDGALEVLSFQNDNNRYGGITGIEITTIPMDTEWSAVAKSPGGLSKDKIDKLATALRAWLPRRRAKPNRIRFLVEPPEQPVLDHKELHIIIGNSDYFTMRAITEISRNKDNPEFGIKLEDIFETRWGEPRKNFPANCIPYHISAQGVLFVTDPDTENKYLVLTLPGSQRKPLVQGWNATFAEQMWAPAPSKKIRPWWETYIDKLDIEAPKDRFGDESIQHTVIRGLREELGIKESDLAHNNTSPILINACIEQDLYFMAFIFVIEVEMTLDELYKRKLSAEDREIGPIAAYPIEGFDANGNKLDACQQFVSLLKEDIFDGAPYTLPQPSKELKGPWHFSSRMRIYASARHLLDTDILDHVRLTEICE